MGGEYFQWSGGNLLQTIICLSLFPEDIVKFPHATIVTFTARVCFSLFIMITVGYNGSPRRQRDPGD